MANTNLHKAKRAKNDEFYTRREDIEAELQHYNEHFRGKVVYCNCDDPAESEFVRYFCRVFRPLGLKKLIATHYDYNEQNYTYSLELDADDDTLPEIITPDCMMKTPLESNGDFRSASCVELLKQADIVVTNPPFSLFREYIAQLVEYDKKFIIIGNKNAITYKEFFPLLMNDRVWVGHTPMGRDMLFGIPSYIEEEFKSNARKGSQYRIVNGVMYARASGCWFTNLDIPKRHETIDLTGNYYDPEVNPKYDNYDAIEVSKVAEIPIDYEPGYLVPVSYRSQLEDAGFILGHERANAVGERCVCVCGRRYAGVESGHDTDGVVQRDNGHSDNVHESVQSESVRDTRSGGEREPLWSEDAGVYDGGVQGTVSGVVREVGDVRFECFECDCGQEDLQTALGAQDEFEYCTGVMGVPITFMNSYCPEQFEIVNANDYRVSDDVKCKAHGLIKDKEGVITSERESRTTYARICIRRVTCARK